MKNMTILLIDDDEELCDAVRTYLGRHGYSVVTAYTPSLGFDLIVQHKPDLILLDVMLPEQDGFAVCKRLVAEPYLYGYAPIIMLTARGDVFDRVVGLELGASDYLPKPFEPRELLARIRSALRQTALLQQKSRQQETNTIPATGLYVNRQQQQVWLDEKLIALTAMEYNLLSLFVMHQGRVLSRDQIMDHLRGTDASIYSRAIDALVKRLRQKLNDDSHNPRFIKTVWGRGYEFLGCGIAEQHV